MFHLASEIGMKNLGSVIRFIGQQSEHLQNTTPFSLIYGSKAVLPQEIQILPLWVSLATKMIEEEKHRKRLLKLEALGNKCL